MAEDPSNPFFLHHSDNPGLALVSQPLTGENYNTWSRSMVMALTAKNKVGFIDGTIQKPVDVSDPNFLSWKRCNTITNAPRVFQIQQSISNLQQEYLNLRLPLISLS